MTIYLAGSWSNRDDVRNAQKLFAAAGLEVISTWATRESTLTIDDLANPELHTEFTNDAATDVTEILHSNVFVIMNQALSEGKAFEMGVAYALGIPIVLIGERTRNIFYHLDGVFRADTVEAAIEGIQRVSNLEFVGGGDADAGAGTAN